jgi:hypothetical protein
MQKRVVEACAHINCSYTCIACTRYACIYGVHVTNVGMRMEGWATHFRSFWCADDCTAVQAAAAAHCCMLLA